MTHDLTSQLQATSLDGLPVAAQHFLAFDAIVTALGFPPGTVGHRVVAVPGIESAPDGLLYATVTANGREFTIAVGPAVPDMAAWLARAAELWASAAPSARDALYDRSAFFQGSSFAALLSTLEGAGFRPPIAPGLVVSRMERAGIAEALRRAGSLEPPRPVVPRASSTPARPVGPPRFELGAHTFLGKHRVSEDEIAPLFQRHASGDWGESRYADDNEAAVTSGRPILSVFRAASGQQVLLITFSRPPHTTVWVQSGIDYPEEGLLDLVCQHVGTGRRAEITASAHGALYVVPLISRQAPHERGHVERAALALLAVISSDPDNEVAFRPEQLLRALWRAVESVDFRPIGRDGARVAVGAPVATWQAALDYSNEQHIGAWFSVRWEERLA